ncbi:eukaryotic translation initiation factor 4 gamma 2 [Amyelois transitella]|uniref:eukaryotic translation initiation factor 4 gamma 2 n=1 Tax=Amyelois transitella TaxID=680683 RepID=UPI0029900477|nr:eukaryotic translation initiation factor 4 gamma 2 [Amyelois transitella]
MYAQLCKRLSEEAPNFEPAGQPCTFKLLLLNKCRTEFENRAQAFAAFEDKALSPEEEEKRHLAKCKMLGNIKFIGELGKLEILAESILHRCIQNLLARRAAAEHHEDLECLAQLVRTCGRVLDSQRGRGLMDQYFARIHTLSTSRELAPRIRFMLRDVVELRRGGWVPRVATAAEGPVPIQQLRGQSPPRREREPLFRRARPLEDVLAGLALQPAAPLPAPDKLFGNGFRDGFRARPAAHFPRAPRPTAPRARRVYAGGALQDVQMRPAPNSLMFSANQLLRPAPPAPVLPAFSTPAPRADQPAIAIKPAPDKKDKPRKDKGVNKEEACRLAVAAVDALAAGGVPLGDDVPREAHEHAERLLALQLPDKLLRRALTAALEHALQPPPEGSVTAEARAWAACVLWRASKRAGAAEWLRARLGAAPAGALLAEAVRHKLLPLAELGAWCEGQHHALLLAVLQRLRELLDLDTLRDLTDESKLNLCAFVSEGGAEPDAEHALAALEARGLAALVPQLRVTATLAAQLDAEPAPHALYRWIKANVEPAVRQKAAFVSALVALLAARVTAAAGSAGAAPGSAALEREKALVETYAPLLTALLAARQDLQLAAVYAVQVHAHRHRYPKGMLLRWFMYLYNLEVVEEDAFLRWREDVTDAYPGKGEALFQVNAWLTWLQQQESEEEDAED